MHTIRLVGFTASGFLYTNNARLNLLPGVIMCKIIIVFFHMGTAAGTG